MQPNGKLEALVIRYFAPDSRPKPRPGARVVVPELPANAQATSLTAAFATAAQIIGSLTALLATIIALRR
jgi:hypothetical protein